MKTHCYPRLQIIIPILKYMHYISTYLKFIKSVKSPPMKISAESIKTVVYGDIL